MGENNSVTKAPEEEVRLALRPQLRLHHFFALTAVAAALLALNGPQQDDWGGGVFEPSRLIKTIMSTCGILYVILAAVAITAVAYGIAWQRSGIDFFNQPGHWLLVEIAVMTLFGMLPMIAFRGFYANRTPGDIEFSMLTMMFMSVSFLVVLIAIPFVLNIYIGRKKCTDKRWTRVFYAKAIAKVLFGIGELLIAAAVLVAVRRDRRERSFRDASHWCGVWLQFSLSGLGCLTLIFTVANMYQAFAQM